MTSTNTTSSRIAELPMARPETPGRADFLAYAQRCRRLFLGSPVDVLSMAETLEVIRRAIAEKHLLQHVVVNVAKLMQMRHDPELRKSVTESDLISIDGMGVVYGCRLLGVAVPERVAGIELMERVLAASEREGWRPFLLGARGEVLDEAVRRIRERHPALEIAGAHHGYFAQDDDERIARLIADARADCLFIAISSPRKENFMNKWRDMMNVPFVMGVGGSIDVIAGRVNRAPEWMQRIGLEWVYRIWQEPRRMWRRYLVTNTSYACVLAVALLGRRKAPRTT